MTNPDKPGIVGLCAGDVLRTRAATPSGLSRFASSCQHRIAIASDDLHWPATALGFAVLLIGLVVTLAGCQMSAEQQQRVATERAERAAHEAYRYCIYDAVGPFGSASIEVVKDCRQRTGYQS